MENTKLNMTFHNPNTVENTALMLIKIAAEVAKNKIDDIIKNKSAKNDN